LAETQGPARAHAGLGPARYHPSGQRISACRGLIRARRGHCWGASGGQILVIAVACLREQPVVCMRRSIASSGWGPPLPPSPGCRRALVDLACSDFDFSTFSFHVPISGLLCADATCGNSPAQVGAGFDVLGAIHHHPPLTDAHGFGHPPTSSARSAGSGVSKSAKVVLVDQVSGRLARRCQGA
jgi:hypothetical protein